MNQSDYVDLLGSQRAHFCTGATLSLAARIDTLNRLSKALVAWEGRLLDALKGDLGKPVMEGYAGEIGVVQSEIVYAIKRVPGWMKPRRCKSPWLAWPSKGWVAREPFGVALILAPWNYPVQLLLNPLVGAIAGGNCAVLKPSELVPQTAQVLQSMIAETFAPEQIACVTGGKEAAEALLEQKFDTIFYTGSAAIGRKVMAAAAKHLTPVTLELGGKCPCIVTAQTRIEVAAKRIIWAKMINAGQTCVAPDFVYIEKPLRDEFLAACKRAMDSFYGTNPRASADYGRIVNAAQFQRLERCLGDGTVYAGGLRDPGSLYFSPTILTDVEITAPVMKEEIFGPILPVLTYQSIEEVFTQLKSRPAPLAIYLFSTDRHLADRVMNELPAGGVCINDLVVQLFGKELPFGGVGESGMGAYHGRASFDCFTHSKTLLRCSTAFDASVRYPPPRISLERFRQVLAFLLRS